MHERLYELLEQLCPSEDYEPAVDFFSRFTHNVPRLLEGYLDGQGCGFEYVSCRFPNKSKIPRQKGVLFVTDVTFGAPDSECYAEVLMSFSEFLRWLRAIARLWSELHPSDAIMLQQMFHDRDLAYFENEVGTPFDNGATWWRKIEVRKRIADESCRAHISSPYWTYAAWYFGALSDVHFVVWLRTLLINNELPELNSVHLNQLQDGRWKFFVPSWGDWPERRVEVTPVEFRLILRDLVEAFLIRHPRHADEVRQLLPQITSRS